ncbi:Carbon monoxide dehydrogenase subunit G [Pedococcus dokdonensis]|uniref:Carbon monoxide dehydrogenase subunit G n=1 Tax=Pedococcus dokdonensis TaxID=443156 RepID=A0A1H0V4L8_9MICO|nr:SRPBCC family protein [Pedococcus dokdonensis]SDP73283.1 Carbon monoxide dehydrogenase subunit G [Pedococcus dokdonensis]
MTVFSASKHSTAVVPHPRAAVWEVLRDAGTVARLTPMVRSIQDHGSTWLWKLAPIEVLGKSIGLSFTERMEFTPKERIAYTHAPVGDERAGVKGTYELEDAGHGTRLAIRLGVEVDLPFPRLAKPAVHASMQGVIAAMGVGFARNLERELAARST